MNNNQRLERLKRAKYEFDGKGINDSILVAKLFFIAVNLILVGFIIYGFILNNK